jgi:hypothetical protein
LEPPGPRGQAPAPPASREEGRRAWAMSPSARGSGARRTSDTRRAAPASGQPQRSLAFPSLHEPRPRRRRRVISSSMKWMTAGKPPERQPRSARDAMSDDGLSRILRARRHKPTRTREKRGDDALVRANRNHRTRDAAAHSEERRPGMACSASRNSDTSAGNAAVSTAGRAITMSAVRAGAASRVFRYASRNRRRARFRSTAPRTWRLTAKPARLGSSASRQSTISERRSIRLPRWKSAWNSALVVSLSRRGNPCGDDCDDRPSRR